MTMVLPETAARNTASSGEISSPAASFDSSGAVVALVRSPANANAAFGTRDTAFVAGSRSRTSSPQMTAIMRGALVVRVCAVRSSFPST
jgi:hypothetical protein